MKMTGAQAVIESLKNEGVEVVFGYPGGKVLTLYDELYQADFNHILTRHEQGAAHAADGYARATGKVGVCIATSGPGATNLVTGIATAYMDSVPIVAIAGQVEVPLIGRDSFQESDIRGITTPITKHNYLVKKIEELPVVIKEAFYIASTGRPGPVVIEIAKDLFGEIFDYQYPEAVTLRGYEPVFAGNEESIAKVVEELKQAKRPLVFVGGGVHIADADESLREFLKLTGFPVISSLMGLGAVPGDFEENLGMAGMHGTYAANMATTKCDLLLGIGVRFSDRVTGLLEKFAPAAKVIHCDIDPAEINKNVRADLKVIGDLRWTLSELCKKVKVLDHSELSGKITDWRKTVKGWKEEKPLTYEQRPGRIMPQAVTEKISHLTKGDAIVVTDVGQHQMWVAQFYNFIAKRSFLTSGGLGTMGYGLPAAIGAQIGLPDKTVVLFSGDGGMMMNCQELATAAELNLPIKMFVINNMVLGMVAQWQRMFYGERYAHSSIKGKTDFVKLAEAMGVTGLRAVRPEELDEVIAKAFRTPGPVLVDIWVAEDENVLPMVPGGSTLDQMVLEG